MATVHPYNAFRLRLANGDIDLDGDTFKVMLTTATYSPDIDAHDFRDDVTNEVSGTGYTAGGETLAGLTLTQNNTSDRVEWDFTDPQWTSASFTARYAVIYKNVGSAATDNLVCYIDLLSDQTVSSGTFTIQLNASGLFAID